MSIKIIKIALAIFTFAIISACASAYTKLDLRINGVLNPKDALALVYDIQSADISTADKRKLNVKLTKRTLKIAEIYIKMVVDGKKTPQKDDILDIIKSLSKSLDESDGKELAREVSDMIKRFTLMLLK